MIRSGNESHGRSEDAGFRPATDRAAKARATGYLEDEDIPGSRGGGAGTGLPNGCGSACPDEVRQTRPDTNRWGRDARTHLGVDSLPQGRVEARARLADDRVPMPRAREEKIRLEGCASL